MIWLAQVAKSKYCWLTFALVAGLLYWLMPQEIFWGSQKWLAFAFIFSLALVITCTVRNFKEKVILAKTYRHSLLSILATAVGLASFQICSAAAPVCGVSLAGSILSFVFPVTVIKLVQQYHQLFLIGSILTQLISLHFLNCFKKVNIENF